MALKIVFTFIKKNPSKKFNFKINLFNDNKIKTQVNFLCKIGILKNFGFNLEWIQHTEIYMLRFK